jgi:hypothetical protein
MRLLMVLLMWPAMASAQLRIRTIASPNIAASDSIRSTRRLPNVVGSSRKHHMKVGAITGAILGGTAGLVGSTFIGTGCTRAPCHETRTRIGIGVYLTALGAITGGVVGAVVGAAIPVSDTAK